MTDAWTEAGITVLGIASAVSATEWAVRVRDRRSRIEEAALELSTLLPYIAVTIWDGWQGTRPDTGVGSEWRRQLDRVSGLLSRIRVNAKWPLRRARKIRVEADDLLVRLAVADMNWSAHRVLVTDNELPFFATDLLFGQVFPDATPMDEAFAWYREHGFASGPAPIRNKRRLPRPFSKSDERRELSEREDP